MWKTLKNTLNTIIFQNPALWIVENCPFLTLKIVENSWYYKFTSMRFF